MARKKGPYMDIAYEYMLNKILSYEFAQGEQISDSAVAEHLGMSRLPVREAIFVLMNQGLIETCDGKTIVSRITFEDISEILQVRESIELGAVKLIRDNGWLNEEQTAAFSGIFDEMNASLGENDCSAHYAVDDQFHQTIISFSGNKRFADISDKMCLQMKRARWLNIIVPQRKYVAMEEHREIYNAILSRDYDRACQALSHHLEESNKAFKLILEAPELKSLVMGLGNLIPH